MNTARSQPFVRKNSIVITLIVTTSRVVANREPEASIFCPGMAFTPLDRYQNNHRDVTDEWWDLSGCADIFVWPTFTLFQNSHHTQPPQTRHFEFPKENKHRRFLSNSKSKCRFCILVYFRPNAPQSELRGTCHSTSGGCSHNASGIWLSGARGQR